MTLPDDPDQTGIEFAGVPDEPSPDGAILEEGVPEGPDEPFTDGSSTEADYTEDGDPADGGIDADDENAARPNWRDFSSEVLEPDQSQPFGDKTPDDLRD